MWIYGFTQFPAILVIFVLLPIFRLIGITDWLSGVISYAVTSIIQAFFFTVWAYVLLYRPKRS